MNVGLGVNADYLMASESESAISGKEFSYYVPCISDCFLLYLDTEDDEYQGTGEEISDDEFTFEDVRMTLTIIVLASWFWKYQPGYGFLS